MTLFVSLERGGSIGPLWHATGTNGDAAGARSSKSMINGTTGDTDHHLPDEAEKLSESTANPSNLNHGNSGHHRSTLICSVAADATGAPLTMPEDLSQRPGSRRQEESVSHTILEYVNNIARISMQRKNDYVHSIDEWMQKKLSEESTRGSR
ncbi:unnamed protein product [Heligmosomoides polygyrus]|uniref:Uncharacterized protein n=1 Tax=Heligmosomoides polygyrus TaxID=6339 RepID=A0A183FH61_HELPZ|nr:unnamed protein product [Heligmosomoides polygyrus]